jgi:endonuclease VIII
MQHFDGVKAGVVAQCHFDDFACGGFIKFIALCHGQTVSCLNSAFGLNAEGTQSPTLSLAMPEGHTIHRAAQDQSKMLSGKVLDVSSPQGRFMDGAALLDTQKCVAIEAFGKHLIYRFANGLALHIHLGLFGVFKTAKVPAAEPVGAVRIRMISATHVVDINGPNTCEILDEAELNALTSRIGPDVLRGDADPDLAFAKITKSRSSIGQLLMDQSVIAGIGNIYRSEILWRQKLHPELPGKQVPREAFDRVWADSVYLLKIGVKHNAIITRDHDVQSGKKSKYGERFNIFNKSHCPDCLTEIRVFEIATRRAFMCETCQPKPD